MNRIVRSEPTSLCCSRTAICRRQAVRAFDNWCSRLTRLTALFLILLLAVPALALHSPKDWYEPSPLDDGDGDKIEDLLAARGADEPLSVIVCFLNDCVPPERLADLDCLGTRGYRSTVIASVQMSDLTMEQIQLIAEWPEVGYIHLDHIVQPHMTTAGQALKAHAGFYSPNTAEDQGFDGSGITVAVIDTGADDPGGAGTTHNHLPAALGGLFMTACNPITLACTTLNLGNPNDEQGHGTAVAGCALGRGDTGGNNRGVAPGAELFDCRITPPGSGGSTASSNIQQVVDWLTWNGNTVVPPVRVANISFGSMTPSSGSALTASIEALVASGVAVSVSAGNQDTCAGTGLGDIAVTTRAITVAAASDENTVPRGNDVIANYSGTGPGLGLSPKPDITAYGNQCPINCAFPGSCSGASTVVISAPQRDTTTGYIGFGGTSAASPMVAGAAALIIERNPAITPAAVKKLLMDNAEDRGALGWDAVWGAGLMDLGPIFQAPPPACDLAVTSVTYSPSAVSCFNPVTITVTVQNVGGVAVTDFSVDWERWYFGPNNQPAQRFPIGAGPQANTLGPLAPGGTRTFNRTWTPGVSDSLPISQHSCFWGIVHASCDTNASNNERNRNVTISGVSGYSCREGDSSGESLVRGQPGEEMLEFPFRIGHDQFGRVQEILFLENQDPGAYFAELEAQGQVGRQVQVLVDNQDCAVWGILRVIRLDPHAQPGRLHVSAYDVFGRQMGDMEVIADFGQPGIVDCCKPDGECTRDIPEDICMEIGGTVVDQCLGDLDGDGQDDACQVLARCGDGFCDASVGENPCNCPIDCGFPAAEDCSDGIDNDCDGKVDCDDADCAGQDVCQEPVACCMRDGTCQDLPALECYCQDGLPQPAGTDCASAPCGGGCQSAAACPHADVNCDDVADGFDIAVIRSGVNWLLPTGAADEPRADVNGDGVIDGFDIAVVRSGVCWLQ